MFGHMKAQPIFTLDSPSPDPALAALAAITENAQPVRWIEFPASILLFVSVQGDVESGAFYVFDRRTRTWFWIDFDDLQYGGYSLSDFDLLIHEHDILSLSPVIRGEGARICPKPRSSGSSLKPIDP